MSAPASTFPSGSTEVFCLCTLAPSLQIAEPSRRAAMTPTTHLYAREAFPTNLSYDRILAT